MIHDPKTILKQYWGFDSFRPLQEEVIREVLAGHDALALMPTGGGKSICFQVPALCQPGICIVVSPLIALMKDQVANLSKRKISALAIFSGMPFREIDITFDNCVNGQVKFLYLSPERLKTEIAIERIKRMKVNLLAVDEAHCISQWGYDFRPSYLDIAELRRIIPTTPVLALTATATPEVTIDIQDKLAFQKPNLLKKSFQRSNLAYVVLHEDDKLSRLQQILKKVGGSSVVYARTRRLAQDVARHLKSVGVSADFYHAGLDAAERSHRQDAWLTGQLRVIVATNAFGMGIDKPDVRTVIHLSLPDSLEAYFQEAGRAGRDEKKAYAILLYNEQDRSSLERNFEVSFPPVSAIRRTYEALGSFFQLAVGGGQGQSHDFDLMEFCKNFQLDPITVHSCLKVLEQEGWIVLSEAYYMPSSFMVSVDRETLYDYQLRNPYMDAVIKTLLRVSEGAFQHFVPINEQRIANFLKISVEKLVAALHHLRKANLIDYRPMKDKPQLVFVLPRADAQSIGLKADQYDFRKERHQLRMQKALDYTNLPTCRSVQLLRYFGEVSEPCGTCDVCLGGMEAALTKEDFERYKLKISQVLKQSPLSERELMECFASNRHAKVLQALTYLLDEGLVVKENDKLRWVSPSS